MTAFTLLPLLLLRSSHLLHGNGFLETLKADLQIDNTFPWTIMIDKQKVLLTYEHSHFFINSDFVWVTNRNMLTNFAGSNSSSEASVF